MMSHDHRLSPASSVVDVSVEFPGKSGGFLADTFKPNSEEEESVV